MGLAWLTAGQRGCLLRKSDGEADSFPLEFAEKWRYWRRTLGHGKAKGKGYRE